MNEGGNVVMMFCKTHVANYLLLAKRAAIVLKFVRKRRQKMWRLLVGLGYFFLAFLVILVILVVLVLLVILVLLVGLVGLV